MAINVKAIKCPSCGANLSYEEGREKMFCSFCGTAIVLTNENEHIYRHIDEAEIKQAETERMIRLKELEIEEAKLKQSNIVRNVLIKIWIGAIIAVAIIGIILGLKGYGFITFMILIGFPVIGGGAYLIFKLIPEKEQEKHARAEGAVRFPKHLDPFTERNYSEVESVLKQAGFTNISCVNMHDLTFGIITKPGKIETIHVDNKEIFFGGKYYMPNVPIVIKYHGK